MGGFAFFVYKPFGRLRKVAIARPEVRALSKGTSSAVVLKHADTVVVR